tara:strand:+ start:359 stop:598 length:240 start_codon:yes stop_codon:yes gene_type:complete
MRVGDLVRFREREVHYDMGGAVEGIGPWVIGLLVEYQTWEKIASILFEGRIIRVAARDVQIYKRSPQCEMIVQTSPDTG